MKLLDMINRACDITSGGGDSVCGKYAIGGVFQMILLNRAQIDQSSITYDGVAGPTFNSLTTLEMQLTYKGYLVNARLRSGGANTELSGGNAPANSKFWKKTVTFTVDSLSQEAANFVDEVGLAELVAVIITNEKNIAGTQQRIQIVGLDGGLVLETATGGTGVALEDLSGTAMTLTGADLYSSKEVITANNTTWVATILAPAV